MEPILDWGVKVVLWLQQSSPSLDLPFKILTFMGNEGFFIIVLPFIYWCVDRRTGARLSVLFLFSAYVNSAVKVFACQPRPFQYDSRVKQIVRAGGGGFPSGHTQGTVVFWGYLALRFRRLFLWVIAGVLIILIPLSRLYLGVHFPTDLLGGYLVGGMLLLLYLLFEPRVETWLLGKGIIWQICSALFVPFLMIFFCPGGGKYGIGSAAMLMGMGMGFILERLWVGFECRGLWRKRILCFLLGMGVLLLLGSGLRTCLSGLEPEPFFRSVRYALMGLWCGLGAPWAFLKLGMIDKKQGATEERGSP
jgi:membrane-associated phospholipid phosphatase